VFNFKKFVFIITILVFIFNMGIVDVFAKKKSEYKYVWKIATVAPDGVAWAKYCRKTFESKIEEVTNNNVTCSWYFGQIMGDEEDYIAKMHIDQLQGAFMSSGGVIMACREMSIMQLPFLFNNYAEIDYVTKYMRPTFNKILIENGYKPLMFVHQDMDQLYSTKYKMRSPQDFEKSKLLMHAGEVADNVLKSLGASPIPMGVPEVATTMRSRICNACISPALWWIGTQLYTITKYVNTTPLRYSPGMIFITMKTWNKLPESYKKAIEKELPMLENKFNKISIDGNKRALNAMINYGVKEIKLTDKELEVFKNKTRPVWDKLAGKLYPKEMLDELLVHLDEFRKTKLTIK